MKFLVAITVLFVIQGCLAKPKARPDAPAGKDSLQELADNAQKLAKQVTDNLGISDLDTKKVGDTINENTNKFLESLQSFITKVKAEGSAHEGEVKDTFKKIETKLAETAADLNKNLSPDVKNKADEMKANFNKAFKDAADQVNQLVKDPKVKDAQNDIKKFSEDFLNQFIEIGKKVESQVKTIVEDHEKTHKH
ncbi:uncharacterized protein [Atheta coriaria]|uniref:uncharacterized protein n=1 Tax=Dalotia coriaria TaxID=877792 RepID=UPI0031F4185A